MQPKLFLADGIRGRANEFPLSAEVARLLGKAEARVLRCSGLHRNRVLVEHKDLEQLRIRVSQFAAAVRTAIP